MDEEGVLALPQPFSLKETEVRRRSGDPDELAANPYAKLRPPLVGYVYHLIGSAADADYVLSATLFGLDTVTICGSNPLVRRVSRP